MSIGKDDPRLTAYALGELGEEDARAIEAELEASPGLREEVAAIRETAALLAALKEAPAALSPERREAITRARKGAPEQEAPKQEAPKQEGATVTRLPRRRAWWMWTAAAAALAIAAPATMLTVRSQGEQERVAAVQALEQESETRRPRLPKAELGQQLAEAKDDGLRLQLKQRLEVAPALSGESYSTFDENPFVRVAADRLSTFSIDVDTASYTLVRRMIQEGQRPPRGAVRIEEMINYFSYDYPEPQGSDPFAVAVEVAAAPWAPEHRLVRVGLKGKHVTMAQQDGSNLVFLVDVSGSMGEPNKLPLLKQGLSMLVRQLGPSDRVSIVVYAGASGLVLPPTPGDQKAAILDALDRLSAGGSTNGGQGIELAYATAQQAFVRGGVNRVILATDGDFNVGVTDRDRLVELIKEKAKTGVFLTTLGFGRGNYKDDLMESLAQHGNGNYAYVDSEAEARKVLVEQASGTLITIAKDVKIQVEWSAAAAESFRLIGYENRVLAHGDFKDDRKDAGEIGADHTVTALYEVVPAAGAKAGELLTVRLRYKEPEGGASKLIEVPVVDRGASFASASSDLRFAAAVASFGMLLRGSPHRGSMGFADVARVAEGSLGRDPEGRRRELVALARAAERLPERGPDVGAAPRQGRCTPGDPMCTDF